MADLGVTGLGAAPRRETPVKLSERAVREVKKLLAEEEAGAPVGLRVGVSGGGCSGMSYDLSFAAPSPGDIVVEQDELKLFVEARSSIFIFGTTIDYEGGLRGRGFVFNNPNASRTCSCGDSFGV